jgi:hypothetical protein
MCLVDNELYLHLFQYLGDSADFKSKETLEKFEKFLTASNKKAMKDFLEWVTFEMLCDKFKLNLRVQRHVVLTSLVCFDSLWQNLHLILILPSHLSEVRVALHLIL